MLTLLHGDCLAMMRELQDASVDAVVTDSPYGLSFMGKKWDYEVPSVDVWRECLRVLKHGGHLLAFAGTRTQHRMACNIEDAGFDIRDMIAWVYGSGFPKSIDVSKAIDKAAGTYVKGERSPNSRDSGESPAGCYGVGVQSKTIDEPQSDAAKQWAGWGTALKPAMEPITVARKPLIGTVAENVQTHGTGAINVDGCRVNVGEKVSGGGSGRIGNFAGKAQSNSDLSNHRQESHDKGRFPANLIHDGSDEVVGLFPQTAPSKPALRRNQNTGWKCSSPPTDIMVSYADSGSAARFFYCAKASKRDRDEGCEGLEERLGGSLEGGNDKRNGHDKPQLQPRRNHHPTVKPTKLMRYLCRLVTPPNGIVLDPFMGSGSTGKACALEGFRFIGIEREAEYIEIAKRRIAFAHASAQVGG